MLDKNGSSSHTHTHSLFLSLTISSGLENLERLMKIVWRFLNIVQLYDNPLLC